ncbi:MAG: glycosyltransferase family 2 protein [Betaproteobacteria bacterium]|nr:glycosyltransferase family 2 protein [Betaproteobacteria bacterium]NBO82597.1 glycosyltransferase [Betaproteobacteria bacterium]
MPKISVVIPVYNEEANLQGLLDQVSAALHPTGWDFELILVDDGSRDGTVAALQRYSEHLPWLHCIFLIRNYGQSTALQAGFDHAEGDYIVTLDGDLQNDPADIPNLIEILESSPDVDCVSGWRKSRQDAAISRRLPSQLANALISKVTRVRLHDYGCALKAYRASIIKSLRLYGELHRFIPALAVEVGAKIVEVPVHHRPRVAGVSKYGIDRTVRVLLDLLWIRFTMRFLHRPIHAFGGIAFAMLTVGLGILAWLAGEKILFDADIGGRPLLMLGVLLTLVGVQLLATGLIGELLVRIYHEPQGRRQYLVRPSTGRQWKKPVV